MDREIFIKCMRFLEVAYKSANLNITGDPEQLRVYYGMLGDLPEKVLMQAIQKCVATSKWPPAISEIREAAGGIMAPTVASWAEGWEQVQKAIRYCGRDDETGALASMDELTAKVTRAMGWKSLCMSDNIVADRAHFQRIYEQMEKRQNENTALPEALRLGIAQTQKELHHESARLLGTTE